MVILIVLGVGIYFVFTNNNTSKQPTPTNTESTDIKLTVPQQQNIQTKTPVKPVTNNTGGILQPPKFPE